MVSSNHLPGEKDLREICGHLLRRGQQIHSILWDHEFQNDLTSPQYGVLTVLAVRPGIDQRTLSQLVSIDKSSIADVVDRLVKRMWVIRERDKRDARRNVLSLSPAALIALRYLAPCSERVQERLVAPLEEAERTIFFELLRKVARFDADEIAAESDTSHLVQHINVPGHLIRRAQQLHTAIWADMFERGLTGPQYASLHVLAQHPGISQRELGDHAAIDKSTAAEILERLERQGWVVRKPDPKDRRRKLLSLSRKTYEYVDGLAPLVTEVQRELLAPLDDHEKRLFLSGLKCIAHEVKPL